MTMKNVLFFVLGIMMANFALGQGSRQTLNVQKLNGHKGKLYIGWYNKAAEFRQAEKACLQKIVAVQGKEQANIIFDNVPPGTYAIAIFFDENDNGKMDTNFFGIPKEKYGFSNNVYPMMRAATFKESAIVIGNKEETISIRLH